MGNRVTRVTEHYKGCTFFKIKLRQYVNEFLKHTSLDYRVTRVTAHYKGYIFLKSEYSQYIDECLSTSLWVTGLQGLQHFTRVAFF